MHYLSSCNCFSSRLPWLGISCMGVGTSDNVKIAQDI